MKQVFNDLVESGAIVWFAISVSLFAISVSLFVIAFHLRS